MLNKLENIIKKVINNLVSNSSKSDRQKKSSNEGENDIMKPQVSSDSYKEFNDYIFFNNNSNNDSYIDNSTINNLSKSHYEPPKKSKSIYDKPSYAPPLKAEEVFVNIFMIDPCLTELQLDKYIDIILSNTGSYTLLMLANDTFESMPLFHNITMARKENENKIKAFLASNRVKENFFNLANVVKTINLRSKDIVIPNMITMQQAKLEEEEYQKERYLSTVSKQEEKAEEKISSDIVENQPLVTLDCDTKSPASKTEAVPNEELKKEEPKKEEFNKEESKKEAQKKVNKYFPWAFKPSKPICNPIINCISIIGSSDISIDSYDINVFNETRKIIEEFRNKTIDVIFYSLNDENIETLSAFGFRQIELLHDKFV